MRRRRPESPRRTNVSHVVAPRPQFSEYLPRFKVRQLTSDVTDVKTQTLGGTIVVKDGKVVYAHQETKSFDNGDAKETLAAVLGKSVAELGDLSISATPAQVDEVCTRPQK